MHPKLADAIREISPAEPAFHAGPAAYRPHAETLLGTGPGLDATLQTKLKRLSPQRRALVDSLVDSLATYPDDDPQDIINRWAEASAASE